MFAYGDDTSLDRSARTYQSSPAGVLTRVKDTMAEKLPTDGRSPNEE